MLAINRQRLLLQLGERVRMVLPLLVQQRASKLVTNV